MNYGQGAPHTAALGELHVHPAHATGEGWDVRGGDGALVGDDRDVVGGIRREPEDLGSCRGRNGLLNQAHSHPLELPRYLGSLIRRESPVGVHPDLRLREPGDRPDRLDVLPVPHLYLEDREPGEPLRLRDGGLVLRYRQGVGADRLGTWEAEEPVEWDAEPPGGEIVQRRVEGGARRRGQVAVLREGSLGVPGVPDLDGHDRISQTPRVLTVIACGGGLAPADEAVLLELEDTTLDGVGRAAGDGEGALGAHRHDPDPRLQPRNPLSPESRIVAGAGAPVPAPSR